uniref:Uncharacterized protein n=1 Tax=Oryza meridionalis TaxID=40149 RepID=A0A0E0CZL2_9ORYZ
MPAFARVLKSQDEACMLILKAGVLPGYTISTGTIGEHIPLRTAACGKKKEAKLMLEAEVDASMHRITLACWDLANGLTCKGIVRMVSECCLSIRADVQVPLLLDEFSQIYTLAFLAFLSMIYLSTIVMYK